MSPKLECHLNWNVNQIGMSLKLECYSNWNVGRGEAGKQVFDQTINAC